MVNLYLVFRISSCHFDVSPVNFSDSDSELTVRQVFVKAVT